MTLAPHTTLRLGGPAAREVTVTDENALVHAVAEADDAGEPLLLLGGGSNVVIADEGFPGLVVLIRTTGIERVEGGGKVVLTVAAGEDWDGFVARVVADGLAGVEALSGIPGSVGATPIQNVGAYGQDVAETIVRVRAYDRHERAVVALDAADCGFGYRHSRFKDEPGRFVVLDVSFALDRGGLSRPLRYVELTRALDVPIGGAAPLADVRAAVLRLRAAKGMVLDAADHDTWSAGSFFTNPILDPEDFAALDARVLEQLGPDARLPRYPEPDGRLKTSAAWLIERAGFAKGHPGRGPATISAKHTLALTNRGDATTADLVALAREVAAGVRAAYGVALVPEPVFVGHDWDPDDDGG
ncbi:UDP-N-acetylmuramate dehydrogenase [Paraconexibacter antarcticus]|uniref:UDP-N-acetylenolpyruvoylglucosamine reductase n=1 Tax=Paraconexibacter antarcticus TaxID=2949664 RepID=A0ABY5DUB0_9ACTN|nr:UDP-N-acetylmuramate dehydrogenase [Paraconexibacter antarcticus]UTI65261.1 UDP-N-acetylmuramate dehydrogenase [Paraconexibacter antarcticus]